MTSEIVKSEIQLTLDGFEGFSTKVEGSDDESSGLVGLKKLKYLAPIWTDPDENEFKRLLVANDIRRRVLKWLEGSVAPVETITLAPGQSWPDIEKMNAKCPQSEWHEAFGKMQGPWQGEHTVLFFDPETMVCYWWPSPLTTVGSAICVRELQAQVKLMRSYKGQYVFPLVELSHTYMPTAYGGRERPHLVIKDWVRFGDGGNVALPAPKTSTLTGSAKATVESKPAATSNPAGMQSVGKLTAKEIIQDSIEF